MTTPAASRRSPATTLLAATRMAWGTLLIASPGRVLRFLAGANTRRARAVIRVLGARQLAQGASELWCGPEVIRLGALGDAAHALSGLALAALVPSWRRAGTRDAAVASGFALWTIATTGRSDKPRRRPSLS